VTLEPIYFLQLPKLVILVSALDVDFCGSLLVKCDCMLTYKVMAHAKRCLEHRVFCRNNLFSKLDNNIKLGYGLIPRLLRSTRQQLKVLDWINRL